MYGNDRTCRAELQSVAGEKSFAIRFVTTGAVNFPPEFGRTFGFEGINGAVVVRCGENSTLPGEVAADWLHCEAGWEVSGFLTRK